MSVLKDLFKEQNGSKEEIEEYENDTQTLELLKKNYLEEFDIPPNFIEISHLDNLNKYGSPLKSSLEELPKTSFFKFCIELLTPTMTKVEWKYRDYYNQNMNKPYKKPFPPLQLSSDRNFEVDYVVDTKEIFDKDISIIDQFLGLNNNNEIENIKKIFDVTIDEEDFGFVNLLNFENIQLDENENQKDLEKQQQQQQQQQKQQRQPQRLWQRQPQPKGKEADKQKPNPRVINRNTQSKDSLKSIRQRKRKKSISIVKKSTSVPVLKSDLKLSLLNSNLKTLLDTNKKIKKEYSNKNFFDTITGIDQSKMNFDERIPTKPYETPTKKIIIFEPMKLHFEFGDYEPFFCSAALYDLDKKSKLSENYYFEVNSEEIRSCEAYNNKIAQKETQVPKAVFQVTEPFDSVYLVIRIEKYFQGNYDTIVGPYMKSKSKLTSQISINKFQKQVQQSCENFNSNLQPFAFTVFHLFGRNQVLLHDLSQGFNLFPIIKIKNFHSDKNLSTYIEQSSKSSTLSKQKIIPGYFRFKIWEQSTFEEDNKKNNYITISPSYKKIIKTELDANKTTKEENDNMSKVVKQNQPKVTKKQVINSIEIQEFNQIPDEMPNNYFVHNLYLYLKKIKLSKRNLKTILIKIEYKQKDELKLPGFPLFYGQINEAKYKTQAYSKIQFQSKKMELYDEIKIKLPLKFTDKEHLLISYYNVEKQKIVNEPFGYSILPISPKNLIQEKRKSLKIFFEIEPTNYLKMVQKSSNEKRNQSTNENEENKKQLKKNNLLIQTKLISTILPKNKLLYKFFMYFQQFKENNQHYQKLLKYSKKINEIPYLIKINYFHIILEMFFNIMKINNEKIQINIFNTLLQFLKKIEEEERNYRSKNYSILQSYLDNYFNYFLRENDQDSNNSSSGNYKNKNTQKKTLNEDQLFFAIFIRIWNNQLLNESKKNKKKIESLYISNSWFLFGLLSKSMIYYLKNNNQNSNTATTTTTTTTNSNKKDFTKKTTNIFSNKFLNDIQQLIQLLRTQVEANTVRSLLTSKSLNKNIAYFCKDILLIINKNTIFNSIKRYLDNLKVKNENLVRLIDLKINFLRIILDNEFYIQLNLPLLYPLNGIKNEFNYLCKKYFLAGLIQQLFSQTLTSVETNQLEICITPIYNLLIQLLIKHERSQKHSVKFKKQIITMYFPYLITLIENSNKIKESSYLIKKKLLTLFLYILNNMNRKYFFDWYLTQNYLKKNKFLDLLLISINLFEYMPEGQFNQNLEDGNQDSSKNEKNALEINYNNNDNTANVFNNKINRNEKTQNNNEKNPNMNLTTEQFAKLNKNITSGFKTISFKNNNRKQNQDKTSVLDDFDYLTNNSNDKNKINDLLFNTNKTPTKQQNNKSSIQQLEDAIHKKPKHIKSNSFRKKSLINQNKINPSQARKWTQVKYKPPLKKKKKFQDKTLKKEDFTKLKTQILKNKKYFIQMNLIIVTILEDLLVELEPDLKKNENNMFQKSNSFGYSGSRTESDFNENKLANNKFIYKIFEIFFIILKKNNAYFIINYILKTLTYFIFTFPNTFFLNNNRQFLGVLCRTVFPLILYHNNETRSFANTFLFVLVLINYQLSKDLSNIRIQFSSALDQLVSNINKIYEKKELLFFKKFFSIFKKLSLKQKDTVFKQKIKELLDYLLAIFLDSLKVYDYRKEPEMHADLLLRIANGYNKLPNIKFGWLTKLEMLMIEQNNYGEAAMIMINKCAMILEFIKYVLPNLKWLPNEGAKIFEIINPSILEGCYILNAGENENENEKNFLPDFNYIDLDVFSEEGLVECLETAIDYLRRAQYFEMSSEIFQILFQIHKFRRDYISISQSYNWLKKDYDVLIKEMFDFPRNFGHYYRIGFYGEKFGENDKAEFIYKFKEEVMIFDLKSIFEKKFQYLNKNNNLIFLDSKIPSNFKFEKQKCYILLTTVYPYFSEEESKKRITTFEKKNIVNQFYYEEHYTLSKKQNSESVKDSCVKKTILTTKYYFPYMKTRLKVINKEIIDFSPIQVAIEDIKKKNLQFEIEFNKFEPRINTLQSILLGTLLTQVNVGPLEYVKAFLKRPKDFNSLHLKELQATFSQFIYWIHKAMNLHSYKVGNVQSELQEKLEEAFIAFKNKVIPWIGEHRKNYSHDPKENFKFAFYKKISLI